CMVDLAKFFVHFTFEHYCGACAPGRLGVKQMLDILTRISQGGGKEEDIQRLERIGSLMKEASLCAMCRAASNPVMTAVRYFRDEYEAHIYEKRCPAGVCSMSQA
ncbi:MAG: NADH-quinone oxidoreductase subunit F, partial [Dehalococcoidia bacterium]|nr:NADH-quinone oxidoreductase subunit F [Dehalococcoidia bacterium]